MKNDHDTCLYEYNSHTLFLEKGQNFCAERDGGGQRQGGEDRLLYWAITSFLLYVIFMV